MRDGIISFFFAVVVIDSLGLAIGGGLASGVFGAVPKPKPKVAADGLRCFRAALAQQQDEDVGLCGSFGRTARRVCPARDRMTEDELNENNCIV